MVEINVKGCLHVVIVSLPHIVHQIMSANKTIEIIDLCYRDMN